MLGDLRYGLRSLLMAPAFSLVAVVTLALGIGANTAMFSVLDAVLLRPLPYDRSDRLVTVRETNPLVRADSFGVSWPNLADWRQRSRSLEGIAGIYTTLVTVSGGMEAERVPVALVSSNLFATLRARPAIGRVFLDEEDRAGGASVAIVSDGLWKRRFASDPRMDGRTLEVNGEVCTVVGVMPPGFSFPQDGIEAWLPLGPLAARLDNRAVHVLTTVARLADGATLERAGTEMAAVAAALQHDHAGEDTGHGVVVLPVLDQMVTGVRPAMLVLAGAVAFVLLIACGNIANLLLARGASRRHEMAIRAALGAGRARMIRQMLTESVLLALLGGGLGLILALWGTDLLAQRIPEFVPRRAGIAVDGHALLFTLCCSLVTGIVFGLAPALHASRFDVNGALRASAPAAGGRARGRLRGALVIAQVALSLVLLVGAGLMIRSFHRVQEVDPGFDTDHLLTLTVSLPDQKYEDSTRVIAFYRDLQRSIEALPGVRSASAVSALPISGGDGHGDLTVEGRPFPPGEAPAASFRRVLPSYFRTMRIPLIQGREFDDHDGGGDVMVVIVNESMARRFWPGENPVGRRIKVGPAAREPWLTIVGVVGDVRNVGLESGAALATYEPHAQRPWTTMNLAVRAAGDTTPLVPAVRELLRAAEPGAPVFNVGTMESRIDESLGLRRFNTGMMRLFSAVALLLAAIGIYGVLSYSVSRRTGEFGIRMALGARRADLMRLVVGQGMSLALAGVVLGVTGALALTRVLSSLLFETSATDPLTFTLTALLLSAVSLAACWLPASRATRVDPMVALRHE